MDAKLIMEYYGVACAILLPLCLVLITIAGRKGGIIDRFNKWIDKNFSGKTPQNQEVQPSAEDGQPEEESLWDKNSKVMTCLKLKTGDSYMCVLTDLERTQVGSQRDWTVSEPFVGEVDEATNVFTAKKSGKTYINCGDVRIYYIEVEPRQKAWFAEKEYNAFVTGMKREKMLDRYPPKKVKNTPGTGQQVVISGLNSIKSLSVQFDKNGKCHRLLYRMPDTPQSLRLIEEGLSERMDRVETHVKDVSFWAHLQGKKGEETVDHAAFVMYSRDGHLMLGIGHNWRVNGSLEECIANPSMFVITFASLVDEDDMPDMLARIDTEDDSSVKKDDHPVKADTKEDEESDVQPEAEPGQDSDEGLQESNDTEWDINLSDEELAALIDGQEPEVEYDEES